MSAQGTPSEHPVSPAILANLQRETAGLGRDQLLWLSGYFAGLARGGPEAQAVAPAGARSLTILFGSESGNSEGLAAEAAKRARRAGIRARVVDMADASPAALEGDLLLIASTWGDGDPPERAVAFREGLLAGSMPRLDGSRFGVCALGDTSYEKFCAFGKELDARFEALGASRVLPRIDCDVDYEEAAVEWIDRFLLALAPATAVSPAVASAPVERFEYTKANPFPAELLEKINLNGTGSAKETLHLEISLAESGLAYEPGDALGVYPENNPALVAAILAAARLEADTSVEVEGDRLSLGDALTTRLDICTLTAAGMAAWAAMAANPALDGLVSNAEAGREYARSRQWIDLLADFPPAVPLEPAAFAALFRKLPPRLYSIASSLRAHPEEVHLTVGAVRYEAHGRPREGVCSTYLADRVNIGERVRVYIHPNRNFKLPEDPATPVIMVGPGTGIAPFRAFIEERVATGATGGNWPFFGDQHYTTDFLYQLELQDYLREGGLKLLDVAFSRDQPEKVYVQDRMLEKGAEIYAWLQQGACFYVCGDASRMAKDVAAALERIGREHGGMDEAAARAWIKALKKEKRFQQDVY